LPLALLMLQPLSEKPPLQSLQPMRSKHLLQLTEPKRERLLRVSPLGLLTQPLQQH
tara:strand:+ start:695 stop:862 length:168 start_codon:yes stop_codon:yes gene_type:complete